jgi:hypothetical protein
VREAMTKEEYDALDLPYPLSWPPSHYRPFSRAINGKYAIASDHTNQIPPLPST